MYINNFESILQSIKLRIKARCIGIIVVSCNYDIIPVYETTSPWQ